MSETIIPVGVRLPDGEGDHEPAGPRRAHAPRHRPPPPAHARPPLPHLRKQGQHEARHRPLQASSKILLFLSRAFHPEIIVIELTDFLLFSVSKWFKSVIKNHLTVTLFPFSRRLEKCD